MTFTTSIGWRRYTGGEDAEDEGGEDAEDAISCRTCNYPLRGFVADTFRTKATNYRDLLQVPFIAKEPYN